MTGNFQRIGWMIDSKTRSHNSHLTTFDPMTNYRKLIVGLVLGLLAMGLWLALGGEAEPIKPGFKPEMPKSEPLKPKGTPVPAVVEELVVEDDGQTLWVSPTSGKPLPLDHVPLGTQLILHVAIADLLAHPEGAKVLAALGPWGEQAIAQFENATGVALEEMVALMLAVRPREEGGVNLTWILELAEPWNPAMLAKRLPEGVDAVHGNYDCRVGDARACCLPRGEAGRILVACPLEELASLAETEGYPPPFPRDMQRLLQRTDARRTATLVFPTKFLQMSGHNLLSGTARDLRSAFQELVGDDAAVVALSAHWGDHFFLELQSTVVLGKRPHLFSAAARQRMSQAPNALAEAAQDQPLLPYGRNVIARFPKMLQRLSEYTRTGEEGEISLMRCYLPLPAGHNLLMAAELALNTPTPAASQGLPALNSSEKKTPQTIATKLQQITSLVFPKETLQQALEILAKDLGVPIQLRGSDLQLEGITKNQSFGLDLRDRSATEILLAVLQQANPDRSASGPADPRQKLVYLVREADGGQPGVIVVTTRSAAARRGDKLPAVFEPIPR